MRGPTLPFVPMKTYGSIFVNLIEKRKTFYFIFLYLCSSSLPFLLTSLFLFIFFFLIWIHGSHCSMCLYLIRVRFSPETIYFFSVQFILNELSSNHIMTSDIFVKISTLMSLAIYHPENCKNIPTVSKFDETFLGHWIS